MRLEERIHNYKSFTLLSRISEQSLHILEFSLSFSHLTFMNTDATPTSPVEDVPPKKESRWKDLVFNKFFDLIIVIAGITIAFELDNFKQDNTRKELERFYLESIVNDLNQDIKQYEENMDELLVDKKFVYRCLKMIEDQQDIKDSIGLVVMSIRSIKTFEGQRNTYSTIISGNGLNVIRDASLRNLMLEHYRLYAAIERFEDKYFDVIMRVNNYFTQYVDYNHFRRIDNPAFLKNVQTKNLLTLAAIELQNGIWRYESSLEKANELRQALKKQLGRQP